MAFEVTVPGFPLAVQTSREGIPIPIVWGRAKRPGNLIWFKDPVTGTVRWEHFEVSGAQSAPLIFALCEGPIAGIGRVWRDAQLFATLAASGWELKVGDRSQTPLAWLSANYAAEALGYGGTALVGHSALPADPVTGGFGSWQWEVYGSSSTVGRGWDAHPADVITDLLTSDQYGRGWAASKLASLATGQDGLAASSVTAYCDAMQFFISVVLDAQRPALDVVREILRDINCAAIWTGGQVKVIPLGDETVGSYVPCSLVRAALTEDDFQPRSRGSDPVEVTVRSLGDSFNDFPVEYTDAGAEYDLRTTTNPDSADIDARGKITAEVTRSPFITRGAHATALSRILAQRSSRIRRTFRFRLNLQHIRLEPLDLVSLKDSKLGLDNLVVRLVSIEEDGDDYFDCVAEEWPFGVGTAIGFTPEAAAGTSTNTNTAPGNAAAPVLAQAAAKQAGAKQRLFVVTSGGADWGGCEVWASWDNASWFYAGDTLGGIHGTLRAQLPAGSDPDITNTLALDLTPSAGSLVSVSTAQRDALVTLSYVDGEWMSYASVANPSGYNWDVTSLRRGAWGSPIGVHAIGTKFARVSPETLCLEIDSSRVGQTLYIKLLSYNKWGRAKQKLADVTAASIVIAAQPAWVELGNVAPGAVKTAHVAPGGIDWSRISGGQANVDNLWPNPTSELAPPVGADLASPEWAGRTADAAAYAGGYVRQLVGAAGIDLWVPCAPGDGFYLQAQGRRTVGTGNVTASIAFYQADQATQVGSTTSSASAGASWGTISARANAPATTGATAAAWCRLRLDVAASTTGQFDAIYARRVATFDIIDANALRTNNYAEDSDGDTTAGAKVDKDGTALKVAPSNVRVGKRTLEQMFAVMAASNHQYVTLPAGSYNAVTEASWRSNREVVAVGTSVAANSTTGGRTWTSRTIPAGTYLSIAHDGSSRIVAVGTNVCATSDDGGATWTARTINAGTWKGLRRAGAYFVCVNGASNATTVARSTDGVTWTYSTCPTAGSGGVWADLGYDDVGRLVATGYNSTEGIVVMYSTDAGATWSGTRTVLPNNDTQAQAGAVSHSSTLGLWVILASRGCLWTSTDGSTWTKGALWTSSMTSAVFGATFAGLVFVAVGSDTAGALILVSTDGKVWERIDASPLSAAYGVTGLTSKLGTDARPCFVGSGTQNGGLGFYFKP